MYYLEVQLRITLLKCISHHSLNKVKYCTCTLVSSVQYTVIVIDVLLLQVSPRACHWLRVVENVLIWLSGISFICFYSSCNFNPFYPLF